MSSSAASARHQAACSLPTPIRLGLACRRSPSHRARIARESITHCWTAFAGAATWTATTTIASCCGPAAPSNRSFSSENQRRSTGKDLMAIKLKRAYEPAHQDDGTRILVDRLWPRGLTKEQAGIDLWLRDVAPSSELRKWSHADPARYDEFRARYARELDARPDGLAVLLAMLQKG